MTDHSIDMNRSKTIVRLSDYAKKMGLISMSVYRGTRRQTGCVLILFHLEIIGDQ